jgi:hypothetical protein
MRSVFACAAALVLMAACSSGTSDPSLGSGAKSDSGSGLGDGLAGADAGSLQAADPGYVPLETSLNGNWMQRQVGNCVDSEEWLSFLLPSDFKHTLVDRNSCGPQGVTWTVGNLIVQPGQLLEMEWQDNSGWKMYRRTSAIVTDFPYSAKVLPVPGYQLGKRALTVLAFVRSADGGQFSRKDQREFAADKAEPFHTTTVAAVQVQLTPPPDGAQPGDACQMALTLAASYDVGEDSKYKTGVETLTLPCRYAKDMATQWLRVTADGYENSASDGSWDKLFETKGYWKKYPKEIAQLLYGSFRPVLLQPPGQRNVLLSDADFGWYPEYLNEPPKKLQ